MARTALRAEAAEVRSGSCADLKETASMAGTAEAMRALRARLSAAQDRAAAAGVRREQIETDHAQTMLGHHEDVRRLEDVVSDLQRRARSYNRALNEAATLVDEMDRRILFFERQFTAFQEALNAAEPVLPSTPSAADITEDRLALDLDLIRKRESQGSLANLRTRLTTILVA